MINKTNILNAINEGIKSGFKFSSNNIKDDSLSIDFSDSKVNNIESFNLRKLERDFDFIDLGLSVKWEKYNIGATCQDTPKSWYGDYYAWGELYPKHIYNENTYDQSLYEKYNNDNFQVLQPEDDIVTQTIYEIDKFRFPTKEEIKELLDESKIKNEWKTNYQGIDGLNGREFTSKINGNSIFIPAAGYFKDSYLRYAGSYCFLWSNYMSYFYNCAYRLRFDSGSVNTYTDYRYIGFSVRGVCS